jgi:putative transcriptional regulator
LDVYSAVDGAVVGDRQIVDNVEISMKNTLRVLRAERNWSQAALAQEAGVSRQTINAIETGKYDPSLPLAFKLAKIFNRSIEEIFESDALV